MRSIPASRFKAECLKLMDEVQKRREPLVITKNGTPVAKLVPADAPAEGIFGCAMGTARIAGDLDEPTTSPAEWKALG